MRSPGSRSGGRNAAFTSYVLVPKFFLSSRKDPVFIFVCIGRVLGFVVASKFFQSGDTYIAVTIPSTIVLTWGQEWRPE